MVRLLKKPRKRHRTTATSQILTFQFLPTSDRQLVGVPKEFTENWYCKKAEQEDDYYCFENSEGNLEQFGGQNLISNRGLQICQEHIAEIEDYSLIIEDENPIAKSLIIQEQPSNTVDSLIFKNEESVAKSVNCQKRKLNMLFDSFMTEDEKSASFFTFYDRQSKSVDSLVMKDEEPAAKSLIFHDQQSKSAVDWLLMEDGNTKSSVTFQKRQSKSAVDSLVMEDEELAVKSPIFQERQSKSTVDSLMMEDEESAPKSSIFHNRRSKSVVDSLMVEDEKPRSSVTFQQSKSTIDSLMMEDEEPSAKSLISQERQSKSVVDSLMMEDEESAVKSLIFQERQSKSAVDSLVMEDGKPRSSVTFQQSKSAIDSLMMEDEEPVAKSLIFQKRQSKSVIDSLMMEDEESAVKSISFQQDDFLSISQGEQPSLYADFERDLEISFHDENCPPGKDDTLRSDTTCASNISTSSRIVRVIDGGPVFYLNGFRGDDTDLARLCFVCGQQTIQSWNLLLSKIDVDKLKKLGEGSFGEVYQTTMDGEQVALKIFPFKEDSSKIYPEVNGGEMTLARDIMTELVITQQLSEMSKGVKNMTPNFIGLRRTFVIRGKYPKPLLEAWNKYDKAKASENTHPSEYCSSSRHYIVMALELGGADLEHYNLEGEKRAVSIFAQVALTLAIAEEEIEFEHRDLHWGNILIKGTTTKKPVIYKFRGKTIQLNYQGVTVRIIDFTLSRILKTNTMVGSDLNTDEDLFKGEEGDIQFDTYRAMKDVTKSKWERFSPKTNCLWLKYLGQMLMEKAGTGKAKLKPKRVAELMQIFDQVTDYASAQDFVFNCDDFRNLVKFEVFE